MRTTLVHSPTIGLERVAREALIILIDTLNTELSFQDSEWADLDADLAERRGLDYTPIVCEPVELQNFYLGHQPSLLTAPVEKYPNVSVMADRAGSAPTDLDHEEAYQLRLYIEIMAKSVTSEEEVNARVQRMADAVNVCMVSNDKLRGTVNGFEEAPTISVTEVFVRKERAEYGDKFMWQGARLEYVVRKEAQIPQGAFSRPASNSPSLLAMADIDQA